MVRKLTYILMLAAMLMGLFSLHPATSASAATLTVNTLTDENDGSCLDGDCSLRDAIAAAFPATQVHIQAQASNASATSLLAGINTWLLRSIVSAGPDIIALTTTTDFHQVACSGTNFFAVAMSNVGANATGDITVSANTGSASLPLSISIEETNPGTGVIIGDHVLQNVLAGQNRTVLVTVTFNGCISFDPALNRIFIEFRDASNNIVGSTSTAVSTNR